MNPTHAAPADPPADGDALPDGELLRRYLAGREESALEALVRRHGPMVLGVCRRVLGDAHDAEDAFQATFLVFVRKAGSIRPRELVGPWLYGVATRTALKARARAARRRAREKQVDVLPEVAAPVAAAPADWRPLLDRAVQALPAKYRLPVILCELQGRSRAEAAGLLKLPEGTLSSRLARARELLRRRLAPDTAAGVAAVLGTAVFAQMAPAAVPAALVQSTVSAATAFAAGAAAGASAPAAALAKGVLTSMRMTTLLIGLLTVGAFGGALGVLSVLAAPPGAGDGGSDRDRLQGTWAVTAATLDGTSDGREIDQIKQGLELVFKGDKVTIKVEAGFTLDPTKSPKQIDLSPSLGDPNQKDPTIRGIYELSGDDLRLCIGAPDAERPAAFASAKGSRIMLLALKRAKAADDKK
jgi:RNA polymerase sigma factor (sigma-70 family)